MKRIDHIGIAVSNLEAALPFLIDILGLQRDNENIRLPEQNIAVQFVSCGDGKIELIAPTSDRSPIAQRLAKRGEGLLHICFEVEDIHAEFDRLSKLGVKFADASPWMSPHGWAVFIHPKTWCGVSIELRQYVDDKTLCAEKSVKR